MRVLIVEDDADLGIFLCKGLLLEGHEARVVGDGRLGLQEVLGNSPDVLILDLGLPERSGYEILEAMQGRCMETSVLVLTGRSDVASRVRCLDLGADDCLLKPFRFDEFIARFRALMRRKQKFMDPTIHVGGVRINRLERTVTRGGQSVEVTAREFLLLEYLMLAGGRTCTRSELLREVWQASTGAGTNVVDVYINYLRRKLNAVVLESEGAPTAPDNIIETVRGEGYMMAVRSQGAMQAHRYSDTTQSGASALKPEVL